MPFVPPPIPTPPIRLRRTGARRGGLPESAPLTRRAFKGPQPKGKSVYVGLMVLVVVGGFFLQLEWGYVLAFGFFIATMFWKPEGLFSKRRKA